MRLGFFAHAISLGLGMSVSIAALGADWMQFGYDPAHTGNNPVETTITTANVNQIVRRYNVPLPASVDSAPVYLSNVSTVQGTKDLLFLLAQNGTLMALDAANGSVVWSHQVSGQQPTTSAPAIDPNRNFVYAYGLDGFVHKYNVGSGNEVTSGGWPELVTLKTDGESRRKFDDRHFGRHHIPLRRHRWLRRRCRRLSRPSDDDQSHQRNAERIQFAVQRQSDPPRPRRQQLQSPDGF